MQMQYRSVLFVAVLASCGDNRVPPGEPPPPDGPPNEGAVCRAELQSPALRGDWDARFTVAGFTGPDGHSPTLYDFARDVDGSIIAAGEFRYVGGTRVEPLMRLRDGQWQPARTTWELPPPGSGFSAISIDAGGQLALATYDDFGERSGEIWLDDGSGLRVIGAFQGLIRRLHWFGGKLWVAGWMQLGDDRIQGLAVWDGTAWTAPPGGAPDGFAFELIEDGNELVVGGAFSEIGGAAAGSVAAFDGTRWRALDFPDVAVYALARGADGELYAGGAFGNLGDDAGGLARWTGTEWVKAAGGVVNRRFPGVVTDIVDHAGSLYISGCFHTVGGTEDTAGAVISRDVARYDGAWHTLDDDSTAVITPWFEPRSCGDEGPNSVWDVSKQAMFSAGNQLLLAGSFPGIADTLSQAVIAHDGTAWRAQGPSAGLGLGGSLDYVGVSGSCEVWGAGQLSHVAGAVTRARVVHFDGAAWKPIADEIPRDAFCPGFAVAPGGDVALGCMVYPSEGDAIGRIYRVSGDHLVQVGTDLPPVQAIAYGADNALWIVGGSATGFVARLAGDKLTMIEDTFDGAVTELDVLGETELVVAGSFMHIGEFEATRIARWQGTVWSALGAGVPGQPTALAHRGETVYVSTFNDGSGSYLLGEFDGVVWRELATPAAGLTPQEFFNFNALQAVDGAVIGVGTVELDDASGRGALTYRNGKFAPLGGGGVHAISLSGLAVTQTEIWVAGQIAEAGTTGSATPSVGVARYVIAP